MKDILQWIPNFLKGMLEVLEKAKEMSGGKVRGHIVFWGVFILGVVFALFFLVNWSETVYQNFSTFLSHFNIHVEQVDIAIPSSVFTRLLFSVLIALIETIALIGLAGTIGAFIGMITSILFPAFTTYRIDKIFNELIPSLVKANELNPTNEIESILSDINELHERWQKRWTNRITRFLTTKANKKKFDSMKI